MFLINYQEEQQLGTPIYLLSEQSFSFEPWKDCDFSLMIGEGYNSLDVCLKTKEVVHLSGLNPKERWRRGKIVPPDRKHGTLLLQNADTYLPGTGITYASDWKTTFDESTGWIRLGNHLSKIPCEYVEFANNTIAAVYQGNVVTIWIRPVFKP